jgi:hypothetical protein
MYVRVYGGSKTQNRLAKDAAIWAGDRLFSKQLNKYINIVIKIKKFHGDEADFHGFCDYLDRPNKPREFELEINKAALKDNRDFVSTIMHELVHVKQQATGVHRDIFSKVGHRIFWYTEDHTDTSYYDSPWEIEAYDLQDKLADEYFLQNENL